MINKIISAICSKLFAEFGEDYEIYKESIEQGLNEPCFFVQCIDPSSVLYISNRRRFTLSLIIQYFPSTSDVYAEINDVIERLDECLETITVDEKEIRTSNSSANTNDKVLTYTLNVDFFMNKELDLTNMEEVSVSTTTTEV